MNFMRVFATAWLLCVLPMQGNARPLVDPNVQSFVKRCNVYVNAENIKSSDVLLSSERAKLKTHKVPISLHLADCENAHYKIRLKNGEVTFVTFGYPTRDDPDYKGYQYEWVPDSPSNLYWHFDFFAWEWGGWLLVDKRSGRKIETKTECGTAQIIMAQQYIATMCSGAYENKIDTLYVAEIHSETVKWSTGIQQGLCPNNERFYLHDIQSKKLGMFSIEYRCESGRPVKSYFSVDDSGLKSRIRNADLKWAWDE